MVGKVSISPRVVKPEQKFVHLCDRLVTPSQLVARFRNRLAYVILIDERSKLCEVYVRDVESSRLVSAFFDVYVTLADVFTLLVRAVSASSYRIVKFPTYRVYHKYRNEDTYYTVRSCAVYYVNDQDEQFDPVERCPDLLLVQVWTADCRCMSKCIVYVFS